MESEQLMRKQLDEQLKAWESIKQQTPPKKGWINLIRTALGLSTRQLAKRVGVSQGQIVQFEKGEVNETITMSSLQKLAKSMECRVVYGLIPEKSLENIIGERSRAVARKRVARVSHTMELESQGVDPKTQKEEIEKLARELQQGPSKKLWGDEG